MYVYMYIYIYISIYKIVYTRSTIFNYVSVLEAYGRTFKMGHEQ